MPGYQRAELESLAQRHGVQKSPAIPTLSRLTAADVPNFATPEHSERASSSLIQRKASKQIKKPMIRTKTRLESFEYKNITAELSDAVETGADAGLVQTLLNGEAKIAAVKSPETRKIQAEARDGFLQTAVRLRKLPLVWLLAPITSADRKNQALRAAIEIRNEPIVLKLLEYGADPNACLDVFDQAVAAGDITVVQWLLRSPKDTTLKNSVLLDAASTAIKTGSFPLLQNVVAAASFTGERRPKACEEAAIAARVDMLLAIVLATANLDPGFLAAIALKLFTSSDIPTGTLHTLLKTLLLAGAHGNDIDAALCFAVERQSISFINLFIKYEADINWGNGRAVCKAVALGRTDILRTLLSVDAISAANASRAVSALPQQLATEIRHETLSLLLDAGATGPAVEKELILAIKKNDTGLVVLLKERGTSSDGGSGGALTAAIQSENIQLLWQLLEGPVSQTSLQAAFPFVLHASKAARLQMANVMLEAGVRGKVLDAALRDAVCEAAPKRDQQLIELMVAAGADPGFDDARSLRHAITQEDHAVFQTLLEAPVRVSGTIISELLAPIGMVKGDDARFLLLRMALLASPTKKATSALLLTCLQAPDTDQKAIRLIIDSHLVDVNHDNGALLTAATIERPGFIVLKKLSSMPDRSRATTSAALEQILLDVDLSETEKAQILQVLLGDAKYMTCASQAFLFYVDFFYVDLWTSFKTTFWPLHVFKALLESGADTSSVATVWESVSKASMVSLLALMIDYPHSTNCIDLALRGACLVNDDVKRGQLVDLILKSAPSDMGLSQALMRCCELNHVSTVKKLLSAGARADCDNHAAVRTASRLAYHDILQALLDAGVSRTAINLAFEEAKKIKDPGWRRTILKLLVPRLTSTELDPYLHELIRSDSDNRNVSLLLHNGADVRYRNDENLRILTKRNDLPLLQKLMQKVSNPREVSSVCLVALIRAQAVTAGYEGVMLYLISCAPGQEVLDRLLICTTVALRDHPNLVSVAVALVDSGADTDSQEGEALCHACLNGYDDAVGLLVQRASNTTRARALYCLVQSAANEESLGRMIDAVIGTAAPPMQTCGGVAHPLKIFLKRRPRSAHLLGKLLTPKLQILSNAPDVLFWAIKNAVSTDCLNAMIAAGADTTYRDPESGDTILLLSIRHSVPIVQALIHHRADISAVDSSGNTALFLAAFRGDVESVGYLVQAGASKNDGSLHCAATALNLPLVELLLKAGHDPNYPFIGAQGRTVLLELALGARVDQSNLRAAQRAIQMLLSHGADFCKTAHRRPLIYWAFDNPNPLHVVTALMQAFLHYHIDEDSNLITEDNYVYSPTMYLLKRRGRPDLYERLGSHGAHRKVLYTLQGRQPEGAVGMPPAIAEAHQRQIDEDARNAAADREHELRIERQRKIESENQRIQRQRHAFNEQLLAEAAAAENRRLRDSHDIRMSLQMREDDQEDLREFKRTERDALRNTRDLAHRRTLGVVKASNMRELEQVRTAALVRRAEVEQGSLKLRDYYADRDNEREVRRLQWEKAVPMGRVESSSSSSTTSGAGSVRRKAVGYRQPRGYITDA